MRRAALLLVLVMSSSGCALLGGSVSVAPPGFQHDGYRLTCSDVDEATCIDRADTLVRQHRTEHPADRITSVTVGPDDQEGLCWATPDLGTTCESVLRVINGG